jgi:GxxExxY protein
MVKQKVKDFLYENESYKIRGACFTIWNTFRGVFKEKIIENALKKELEDRKLKIETQKKIPVYYKNKKVGVYVPDFVVEDKILMEIKVKPFLTKEDERQFWYYLRGSNYKLGFLVNFGSKKLEIKRRIYDRARKNFQRFISVFIIPFLVFLISVLSASIVKGQEKITLGVSPLILELDAFLGEEISKEIKVTNKSEVPVPILARVLDFSAKDETGEIIFGEGESPSRSWFEVEPKYFILNPKEFKNVNVKISVPKDALIGGYYSVLFFEPQLPSYYFQEEKPKAIPIVGVLFMVSVKTLSLEAPKGPKLEMVEFSLPKEERMVKLENFFASIAKAAEIKIVEKSPSKFTLRIKNNDIYHLKPEGKILIYNFFGKKVGEAEVEKQTILPGKTRSFSVNFSPKIPEELDWLPASISDFLIKNTFFGKYKAILAIEAKDAKIENAISFWAFPWKISLIVFVLLLTLIFAIIYKRRIKLALRILVRGKEL